MSKLVWVELNDAGTAVRIFKTRRAAYTFGKEWIEVQTRAEAVSSIRRQIFYRSRGFCEICGDIVLEKSGHMHEKIHRGKGGDISLANSIFICPPCHQRAHSDRNPKWRKQ